MKLLLFINDHVAISLVILVVLIALFVFLAQKISTSGRSNCAEAQRDKSGAVPKPRAASELAQSPAAKAFRAKLKEINLDLDSD